MDHPSNPLPPASWLGRKDSNLRIRDPKTRALPLGDAPIEKFPRVFVAFGEADFRSGRNHAAQTVSLADGLTWRQVLGTSGDGPVSAYSRTRLPDRAGSQPSGRSTGPWGRPIRGTLPLSPVKGKKTVRARRKTKNKSAYGLAWSFLAHLYSRRCVLNADYDPPISAAAAIELSPVLWPVALSGVRHQRRRRQRPGALGSVLLSGVRGVRVSTPHQTPGPGRAARR
jgi:hypothetical protein